MAQLLDYRSSVNSNTSGYPFTPLSTNEAAPTFLGGIGLIVNGATNIRVNLWGTEGLISHSRGPSTIRFFITRNSSPITNFTPGNVIFRADHVLPAGVSGVQVVTINAADSNPAPGPVPQQINYSLFAVAFDGNPVVIRNGPEVFTGLAVTG